MPNKLEIFLSLFCIAITAIMTGILLPFVISSNRLSISEIIIFLFIMFFVFLVGVQSIFNIFYIKWQKKNESKKYCEYESCFLHERYHHYHIDKYTIQFNNSKEEINGIS